TLSGSGPGQVLLSHGNLQASHNGATLQFPGSTFQWTGGVLDGSAGGDWTNSGVLNLVGSGPKTVYGGTLHNQSSMLQTGAGNLEIAGSTTVHNEAAGTYELHTDAGITYSGLYGSRGSFLNDGTLLKSAGAGNTATTIDIYFT